MNGTTVYKLRYKPTGEFYTFNLKGNSNEKRTSRLTRTGTSVASLIAARDIMRQHIKWNSDWKLDDFEVVQFMMKESGVYHA